MVALLRAILFRSKLWHILELGIVGLFFWQGLRQLVGELYRQSASASLVALYPPDALDNTLAGIVTPDTFVSRLMLLVIGLFLPLLAGILGRWRWSAFLMVTILITGRVMLNFGMPLDALSASGLVTMAGMGYVVAISRRRASNLPYFFILGLGLEQIARAFGDTIDPLLHTANLELVLGLSLFAWISASTTSRRHQPEAHDEGYLTFWSGVGIGALLFLQLSLFSLPNAIAGRTEGSYSLIVPLLIGATLAPLIPFVRVQARQLVAPFDSTTRGWLWFLLLIILIIIGTRIPRISLSGLGVLALGSFVLVLAQLGVSLLWWYCVRLRDADQPHRGVLKGLRSGIWALVSLFVLGLFALGDNFTYEYAFVRDFLPPFDAFNALIPPLLRGFRGMGLALLIIGVLLATLPMILASKRIPWERGRAGSWMPLLFVLGLSSIGAWVAQPPLVTPVIGVSEMRVGTYNIHGGYSEFFDDDLIGMARAISQSGADVVLLQEVDAGRLASFGVDQSLWLARRLGMDRRFYGTIEGLRGLAVLSRAPIVFADGVPLDSIDQQTGLQRVQVLPSEVPITFYNTMLGLLLEGDSIEEQERNQRQQLNQILATIDAHIERDYGGRVENVLMVLGGTFHNVPDSPLLQILERTGFSDPFAGANPDLSATLVTTDRRGRIDYLWIWRQGLRWTGNGVIDSRASDHRLAFVNLLFGR